jgi:two-component system, NtrC family, sensor histidine kinase HydH
MNIPAPECHPAPRYTEKLLLTETHARAADTATIVGQLAHELRQPLSAMEAITYYLHLTVTEDPRARAQIEKLRQLIEQTGWIISDAVHFLQPAPLRPALQDLHELLDQSLSRLSVEDQDLIELHLAEDLPPLSLDHAQIEHLLATAIRFCLRSARHAHAIEVHTYADTARAAIVFTTQSRGPAVPYTEEIFAPFEDHPAAAAGLGLASARRIAEAHGGTCDLLADPDGRLCLSIFLPLPNA